MAALAAIALPLAEKVGLQLLLNPEASNVIFRVAW